MATLSRLEFSEDEIDQFTQQMDDIINMANTLSEIDTEGVAETNQVVDRDTVFRADKVEHWQTRKQLLENVPETSDGFIKVPVIIDKDDND